MIEVIVTIVFIVIVVFFLYACCEIASKVEHDYEEDWEEVRKTKKKGNKRK